MNNIGSGTDTLIKYFYDTTTARCREFVYSGGDGGNANRFDSLDECHKVCTRRGGDGGDSERIGAVVPDASDLCTLPTESGPCTSNVERWFYDASLDECRLFIYGGCDGNRNRFMTLERCQASCRGGATARPAMGGVVASTQPPRDTEQGRNNMHAK